MAIHLLYYDASCGCCRVPIYQTHTVCRVAEKDSFRNPQGFLKKWRIFATHCCESPGVAPGNNVWSPVSCRASLYTKPFLCQTWQKNVWFWGWKYVLKAQNPDNQIQRCGKNKKRQKKETPEIVMKSGVLCTFSCTNFVNPWFSRFIAEREEARPAISGNTIKSQIVENVRFAFLVNTTESHKIPQSCPCFVYKFVYTQKRAFSRRVHQRSSKSDIDFSFSSSTILT